MKTIKETIDEYINSLISEYNLSNNTMLTYKKNLDKYYLYLNKHNIKYIDDIKKEDINNFLKELRNNKILPQTEANYITSIKNYHKFLIQNEYINIDISKVIERPKLTKKLPNTLSLEDVNKLLDIEPKTIFDYRNKCMLELLYGTGLRISEALSLTLNGIDKVNCTVRCIGKGNKERIVPINDYIISSLNDYLKVRNELLKDKTTKELFLNRNGDKLNRKGFNKILKKLLLEKGLNPNISPHTLRHSYATHLLNGGADLRIIQELLGHTDIKTTRIYTHISNKKVYNDYNTYHPRNKED